MKHWNRKLYQLLRDLFAWRWTEGRCPICWNRKHRDWHYVPWDARYEWRQLQTCCQYCWERITQEERLTLAFNAYTKHVGSQPSGEHYQTLVQGIWH